MLPVSDKDTQSPIIHLGMRVLGVCLILASPFALFVFWERLQQARDSSSWPTTPGRITRSEIETNTFTDTTYRARVEYEFTVSGNLFKGNRVGFNDGGSKTKAFEQKVVQDYPPGSAVTVSYHPKDPRKCVLEAGAQWSDYGMILFALLMLGIGILAWNLPRKWRASQQVTEPNHHPAS